MSMLAAASAFAVLAGATSLPLLGARAPIRGSAAFSDSGRFERWSHFKDYGVPGTAHDPVNRAMIADGSCRLLDQRDGYLFWHDAVRSQRVADALASAPPTSNPSHFTLATARILEKACFASEAGSSAVPPTYNESVIIASMQNWYKALCAPEDDPAWAGSFDPAYQPQQVALTAGFMCIVACDASGLPLPAASLASLADTAEAPSAARDAVCAALPWGRGTDFKAAADLRQIAVIAAPLLERPCSCGRHSFSV